MSASLRVGPTVQTMRSAGVRLFGRHVPQGIAVALAAIWTPRYTEFPRVRCYRSHRSAQERPSLEGEMTVFFERRKCLALLGGVLVWPLVARAQAPRVRRIGVLIYGGEDSRGSRAQVAALRDGLKELGWVEDHNLRMEIRFDCDSERLRAHAEALVSQVPDVIVVSTNAATKALQQQTQTIPIVFAGVAAPSRANCRCKFRLSSSWRSISRPRRRWASKSPRCCSRAPTR
jgi:hypothetical protein